MAFLQERFSQLRELANLNSFERRLLLEAYLHLLRVDITLQTVGLRRVLTRMEKKGNDPPPVNLSAELRDHICLLAKMAETACNHWWRPTRCQQRAFTLFRLLERHGVKPILLLGTQKGGRELHAHLWVEVGDLAFDRQGFEPMAVFASKEPAMIETR